MDLRERLDAALDEVETLTKSIDVIASIFIRQRKLTQAVTAERDALAAKLKNDSRLIDLCGELNNMSAENGDLKEKLATLEAQIREVGGLRALIPGETDEGIDFLRVDVKFKEETEPLTPGERGELLDLVAIKNEIEEVQVALQKAQTEALLWKTTAQTAQANAEKTVRRIIAAATGEWRSDTDAATMHVDHLGLWIRGGLNIYKVTTRSGVEGATWLAGGERVGAPDRFAEISKPIIVTGHPAGIHSDSPDDFKIKEGSGFNHCDHGVRRDWRCYRCDTDEAARKRKRLKSGPVSVRVHLKPGITCGHKRWDSECPICNPGDP